jgi:hypothetical protein
MAFLPSLASEFKMLRPSSHCRRFHLCPGKYLVRPELIPVAKVSFWELRKKLETNEIITFFNVNMEKLQG